MRDTIYTNTTLMYTNTTNTILIRKYIIYKTITILINQTNIMLIQLIS